MQVFAAEYAPINKVPLIVPIAIFTIDKMVHASFAAIWVDKRKDVINGKI